MAAPVRRFFFCCIILSLLPVAQSIFEDQAGRFDWRQRHIGKVERLEFDQSTSSATGRKVFVATKQNVVAAINVKHGNLVWRQILEEDFNGAIDSLLHHKEVLISVSGQGRYIRRWHTTHGNVVWETFTSNNNSRRCVSVLHGSDSDSVAVLTSSHLNVYSVGNGVQQVTQLLPDSQTTTYKYLYQPDPDSLIAVGVYVSSHVTFVRLSSSGAVTSQRTVPAPWIQTDTGCLTAGNYLVCLDNRATMVYSISMMDGQSFSGTHFKTLQLSTSMQGYLLSHLDSTGGVFAYKSPTSVSLLQATQTGITLVKDFPQAVDISAIQKGDSKKLVVMKNSADEEESQLLTYDIATKATETTMTAHTPSHHGKPERAHMIVFKKRDSFGFRSLVQFEDDALLMFQQSGKLMWSREESLASWLAVEMVDLPVSENQAKMEEEFGSKNDVLLMFVNRLTTQLSQLRTFVMDLKAQLLGAAHHQADVLEEPDTLSAEEEREYTRDEFNMHKMIVGVSESGKIVGMDSISGKIVWRHFITGLKPFQRFNKNTIFLFVQRTTAHFPHPPQCVVVARQSNGHGLLYFFNPISGKPINSEPNSNDGLMLLDFNILQTSMTEVMNEDHLKGLIVLDSNKKVHSFPRDFIDQVDVSLHMFTVNQDTGVLNGYRVKRNLIASEGYYGEETWVVNIPLETQVIESMAFRRPIEHVHSQGKILADRSVLYKYVNPNLVAIATVGTDATHKSFISVYLLDTVTGRIVFHTVHKKSSGPIRIVQSENWVVYNYWSQKHRRSEIAVLELFEGTRQHNATAFSSLNPPPPPIVMRQAYILPVYISAMAVTLTEMGLTAKHLLLAMKNGPIAEMPKFFLDPRRPVMLTPEHREEGIIPYMPELPISYEYIVNYNQSVFNIRGIHTAPAGLESTSLLLAYGLDLFYSRVMPSKMFDVLKEDFDYLFIGAVLFAMILVSIISQKLSVRKSLSRAWH